MSSAPYIERKLFTVNTGHASAAYFGFEAGLEKISEAMADQDVAEDVRAVLEETKQLLVAKHGFNNDEQEAYVQKILVRFSNPHLPDTVNRVGRAPLRKLSRHERFIGPAAELAERGIVPEALLGRSPRPCASPTRPTPRPPNSRRSCPPPRRPTPRPGSPGWLRTTRCSMRCPPSWRKPRPSSNLPVRRALNADAATHLSRGVGVFVPRPRQ